jgi:hypothetical protein
MRKILFFLAASLYSIFLISSFSNAQPIGKFSTGGSIGAGKVTSGGDDVLITMELNTTYRVDYKTALVAVGSYSTQSLYSFIEVTGNARYYVNPQEKVKFFGEGGLGIYSIRVDLFGLVYDSKSYFGINAGGGVTASVTDKIDVILKAKYHNPLMSGDGKVNWINVNLGVNVGI